MNLQKLGFYIENACLFQYLFIPLHCIWFSPIAKACGGAKMGTQ